MNKYLSSASLKSLAKGQLLGKYGIVITACLLHYTFLFFIDFNIVTLVDTTTFLSNIIYYILVILSGLLGGIFLYGEAYIYMKIACNQPVSIQDLFFGFRNDTESILKLQFFFTIVGLICSLPNLLIGQITANPNDTGLMIIYIALMLLATAVNVYFSLTFSQCYYLLLDFPQYTTKELFQISHKIMKGNKGRLFYIELSFLPLYLLGILSCCAAYLWVMPYFQAVKANFYLDLVKKESPDKLSQNA